MASVYALGKHCTHGSLGWETSSYKHEVKACVSWGEGGGGGGVRPTTQGQTSVPLLDAEWPFNRRQPRHQHPRRSGLTSLNTQTYKNLSGAFQVFPD